MTDTSNDTDTIPDWPGDDVHPMWAYDGETIFWEPFHGFSGGWRITDEDAAAGTVSQSDATTATIAWDDGRIETRTIVDSSIAAEYTIPD